MHESFPLGSRTGWKLSCSTRTSTTLLATNVGGDGRFPLLLIFILWKSENAGELDKGSHWMDEESPMSSEYAITF